MTLYLQETSAGCQSNSIGGKPQRNLPENEGVGDTVAESRESAKTGAGNNRPCSFIVLRDYGCGPCVISFLSNRRRTPKTFGNLLNSRMLHEKLLNFQDQKTPWEFSQAVFWVKNVVGSPPNEVLG
jgi:hypothetical protein